MDAGLSITEFGRRDMSSSVYRLADGAVACNAFWERTPDVDQIPSPWLTGILDEFFDGRLAPLLETNRGCPFTCTFCAHGTNWCTRSTTSP